MSVEKSAEEEEEGTVLVSRPEDIHDIIKEKGVRGGVRGGGGGGGGGGSLTLSVHTTHLYIRQYCGYTAALPPIQGAPLRLEIKTAVAKEQAEESEGRSSGRRTGSWSHRGSE